MSKKATREVGDVSKEPIPVIRAVAATKAGGPHQEAAGVGAALQRVLKENA